MGHIKDMSKYSSKFSPGLKLYLNGLNAEENPNVTIIIRTSNSLKPEHKLQLKVIGAEIRSVAGDVFTLVLPARNLTMLASKDFVMYIELTRPLYPE